MNLKEPRRKRRIYQQQYPPLPVCIARERQWRRRKEWLEEVKQLSTFPLNIKNENEENSKEEFIHLDSDANEVESSQENEPMEVSTDQDDDLKIIESKIHTPEIDEVVLDSTEEEEVCEIINKTERSRNDSQDDICVLNDLQSQNDFSPSPTDEIEEVDADEMLVLPDSDSDTENYLNNVNPRVETGGFPLTETLLLTFEETFFLMFGLGCLQLLDFQDKDISIADAWTHFNQDKLFLPRYIELLVAQVLWPSSVSLTNPVLLESLSEFTVRELLWRRWKMNEKDDSATNDESSDDSS
ncbi:hypothetical protein G9C98_005218 [Cotesia typhae]|uniref:Uncharacterized protein n=1 Tax=Cotesia typhae TaxID=2053667 RepID=A0A8J5RBI9_9HYME|nr:hypothetical protein G9C98_005218 [Cotesia typhae]